MGKVFAYLISTRLIHGEGSIELLGEELKKMGSWRPWVVTDQGLVTAGLAGRVLEILKKSGLEPGLFSGVKPTASVSSVETSLEGARRHGYDGVVALGGGSPLVVGKATAIMGTNEGHVRDYDGMEIPNVPLPLIAVPTTAGSGSEVSQFCPIVDEERQVKILLKGRLCFPPVAILDPALLATVPTLQAVLSGVDALAHAIEAQMSVDATPITDALAQGALRMLSRNLRESVMARDLKATEQCLIASSMANMACGNAKLTLGHGLARNVQALFGVQYGVTIGVFLPIVMEFNLPAATERFAKMAPFLDVPPAGLTLREQAFASLRSVKQLLVDLNCPRRFDSSQVKREAIPTMAKMAFGGPYEKKGSPEELPDVPPHAVVNSPNIRRATYSDVVALYERSLEGWDL